MQGETKEEFNERVIEHREKVQRSHAQATAFDHAKRMREMEDAEEAERLKQPQFAPGMSIEAYIKKIRAWHVEVFGSEAFLFGMPTPPSLKERFAAAAPAAEAAPEGATSEQNSTSGVEPPARGKPAKRRNRQNKGS